MCRTTAGCTTRITKEGTCLKGEEDDALLWLWVLDVDEDLYWSRRII